jgi:hypothetical protein
MVPLQTLEIANGIQVEGGQQLLHTRKVLQFNLLDKTTSLVQNGIIRYKVIIVQAPCQKRRESPPLP